MNVDLTLKRLSGSAFCLLMLWALSPDAHAQFQNKWLSAGSFHNWYSEVGSEREHGDRAVQQHGWRWPGIYRLTDMQAAKALWIGARNVTDAQGSSWPVRVVHAGPRATGAGEFFPVRFELVARRDPTLVVVDGDLSIPDAEMIVDTVDPDLLPDAMIVNEANTLLGITMERRIMQFSQDYHDNYHIIEYTFTNTGRTGSGPEVTLPNQILEDVYFFMQYRLSIAAETRYVIGNATGWGINTMNDARGDGVQEDPPGERFRAQFSWHGHYPGRRVPYDNLGGPILPEGLPFPQPGPAPSDTLGRLGASQFAGVVTIHADTSPTNPADDSSQPSTTTWISSDAGYQSGNSAFSLGQMQTEFDVMTHGNRSPRHAMSVEPTGLPGFLNPTGNPAGPTPGGYSFANGFGPYTLGPGESVRIVVAEGAAGLSRQANTAIGRAFRQSGNNTDALLTHEVHGQTHSMTKNEWVFTSRDSLFQTFHRAIANYESDFALPRPPAPPATFTVSSGGDRITLDWETHAGEPPPDRFELYRARARFDSTYTLIRTAGPAERTFDDETAVRGIDYFYYILAVNDNASDGTALTPPGVALASGRHHTQTYVPARLQRPMGPSPGRARFELADEDVNIRQNGENGENVITVTYADERGAQRGGVPPGFRMVEARIVQTVCVEWDPDDPEVCVRTARLSLDAPDLPVDFRFQAIGSSESRTIVVEQNPNVLSRALEVAFLDLTHVAEARLEFNGVEMQLPASVVGPEALLDAIRIVPNPFNIASSTGVRFDDRTDKLAFFNIPGFVRIDIYTEIGELVDSIIHDDGSGDAFWDHTTTSRQVVVSGVYIAVFTVTQDIVDDVTGETLFRQGERAIRKFVIIR